MFPLGHGGKHPASSKQAWPVQKNPIYQNRECTKQWQIQNETRSSVRRALCKRGLTCSSLSSPPGTEKGAFWRKNLRKSSTFSEKTSLVRRISIASDCCNGESASRLKHIWHSQQCKCHNDLQMYHSFSHWASLDQVSIRSSRRTVWWLGPWGELTWQSSYSVSSKTGRWPAPAKKLKWEENEFAFHCQWGFYFLPTYVSCSCMRLEDFPLQKTSSFVFS